MKKRHLSALLLIILLPALTQAQNAWTNSFDIVIFNRSIPAVSTNEINITWNPVFDTTRSTVELSNTGNKNAGFTVSGFPQQGMASSWIRQNGWQTIDPRIYDFYTNDVDGNLVDDLPIPLPDTVDIGFDFPYFGEDFDTVIIEQDGRITLYDRSPLNRNSELYIFYDRDMETSLENIRYRNDGDRFVVSWIDASIRPNANLELGLTNLSFQVHLYKSGEVRYLYQTMGGAQPGDASVAYKRKGSSTIVDVTFDEDNEGVTGFDNAMAILTPTSLFSTSAEANPVGPVSTNTLTVVVDNNALKELGLDEEGFDLSINWDNGTTNIIDISAKKIVPTNRLEVLNNSLTLPLNAPLGVLAITNAGNTRLNYSIVNPSSQTVSNYTWTPTSFIFDDSAGPEFIPTDTRNGVTELVPLSFPFPFFGKFYTNFSISVNGYIMLGTNNVSKSDAIIAPYWTDLIYKPNISKISTVGDAGLNVITWKAMESSDGPDQTFQIILERDGTIIFQYEKLNGTNIWTTASDFSNSLIYQHYLANPSRYGNINTGQPEIPPRVQKAIGLRGGGEVVISNAPPGEWGSVAFINGALFDTNLVWSPGGDSNAGTVITNEVVTESLETTWHKRDPGTNDRITDRVVVDLQNYQEIDDALPDDDIEVGDVVFRVIISTLTTTNSPVYDDPLFNQAFQFKPSATAAKFSFSPLFGSLLPGESQDITVDGRAQAAGAPAQYNVVSEAPDAPFTVTVTNAPVASSAALMDRDFDGQSDFAELLAGTDPDDAESRFSVHSASSANADGSRTISWTEPGNNLNRSYTIWYTTNLLDGWQALATVTNGTSYTDTEHNDVPAIYYKVTVE